MNQSLNEFMKSMQRTSNRSLAANADASLDITSLDEDLTDRSAGQVLGRELPTFARFYGRSGPFVAVFFIFPS